ncbi:C-terminal binding protein [Pseudomonadota bacterium]
MSTPLVAVADSVFPSLDPAKKALASINAEMKIASEPTVDGILEVARKADGLLVTYANITAEIIEQLENCKVIARTGIGVDNIDVPAATKKGITVTFVPDYCIDEVSDHAMAMLLSMIRKIPFSNQLVQSGRWEMPAVVPIARIRGKTLGLVGFGNIPQLVAVKAQAFGINVIASDPFIDPEIPKSKGVELVEFEAVLTRSDYVSIHAPLTPKTENLFSTDAFSKMKSTAILVNTARGPLVDGDALCAALDAGEISAAALDVAPVEPMPADSPLLGRDNLILSPHTGFYSIDALDELQTKAASDIAAIISGKEAVYPVNAKDLG